MQKLVSGDADVNRMSGQILTFCSFSSVYAEVGENFPTTWKAFAERLEVPVVRDKKEQVPCFILGKSLDGKALKSSLECTFAIGFDYDHTEVSFDAACMYWSNYDAIAYTTWNHTDEQHRFRILLRTSRAILPSEHARVWEHLAHIANRCHHNIDAQAGNAERKWFVPAHAKGSDPPEFRTWEGEPIDVDKILAASNGHSSNGNGHAKKSETTASSPAADLGRVYALADIIRKTPKGMRNYVWNRDVFTLAGFFAAGRLDPALSEDMILDVLYDAMRANSELPDREVKKLQKSWEDGKRKPLERQEVRTKPPPLSAPVDGQSLVWTEQLTRNGEGKVLKSTDNYRIIFENADFTRSLIFDEFYDSLFVEGGERRAFDEHADMFNFNVWLSQRSLPEVPSEGLGMLLGYTKTSKKRNALQDHLQSLKWDGVPRLDTWLMRYLGADDTPYTRSVGRLWLVSAMARAFKPGCQVDYALILEGPQGIGKSTALRILGGAFYSGNLSPIGTKDAYQEIQRVWIQELSELESFNRSQLEQIKNFITGTNDIFRPSYGKIARDHLRHLVFAGTSNDFEYLRDQTGNRRFWPIRVTRLDTEAFERDRDALLAEALLAFVSGEPWWPSAELTTLASQEQDIRRSRHPWEDRIARFVFNKNEVTIDDIRQDLDVEIGRWSMNDQKTCGTILRSALGWLRIRKRVNNVPTWVYLRPDAS